MKRVGDPSVSSAFNTQPKRARVLDVQSYFTTSSRLVFFIRLHSLFLTSVKKSSLRTNITVHVFSIRPAVSAMGPAPLPPLCPLMS